jgi:hypothetical protein
MPPLFGFKDRSIERLYELSERIIVEVEDSEGFIRNGGTQ